MRTSGSSRELKSSPVDAKRSATKCASHPPPPPSTTEAEKWRSRMRTPADKLILSQIPPPKCCGRASLVLNRTQPGPISMLSRDAPARNILCATRANQAQTSCVPRGPKLWDGPHLAAENSASMPPHAERKVHEVEGREYSLPPESPNSQCHPPLFFSALALHGARRDRSPSTGKPALDRAPACEG